MTEEHSPERWARASEIWGGTPHLLHSAVLVNTNLQRTAEVVERCVQTDLNASPETWAEVVTTEASGRSIWSTAASYQGLLEALVAEGYVFLERSRCHHTLVTGRST